MTAHKQIPFRAEYTRKGLILWLLWSAGIASGWPIPDPSSAASTAEIPCATIAPSVTMVSARIAARLNDQSRLLFAI